ncbi:MAG: hypothetical protein HWE26_10210 [Alteromonadaceae bacterium]|nr:hypothetical protein [Alteromonadaceae bacterium]
MSNDKRFCVDIALLCSPSAIAYSLARRFIDYPPFTGISAISRPIVDVMVSIKTL